MGDLGGFIGGGRIEGYCGGKYGGQVEVCVECRGMWGTVEDYLGSGGLREYLAKIQIEHVDYYIYMNIPYFK